jgi:monoamine oxidase
MSRSLYATLHRRYGPRLSGVERQQQLRTRLEAFADESPRFPDPVARIEGGPKKKVIIVGGGFAGLMAAYTLSSKADVTLFEARERLGGRVHSLVDPTTQRITEAGAELIGYAHPTWLTLARRFDLALIVWTSDGDYDALRLDMPTYMDGRLLSSTESEKVYDEMNAAFAAMSQQAKLIHDAKRPWTCQNAQNLDAQPLSTWIAGLSCSPLTKQALELQFANTNGAPSRHQSYLANLALLAGAARHGKPDDFFTMSENVRCAQGNAALAEALAGEIKKCGGNIHKSTPITRIQIENGHVLVGPDGGQPIKADFVILAIPPSVWPNDSIPLRIHPPIPPDCYMTMGTAVKYLSRMATRFWIAERRAPSAVSDQCGMLWEGTDNQMQTSGQDVELTVFAGGDAANAAVHAERGGHTALRQFYDDRINPLYATYTNHRHPDTTFVNWPRDPWTMSGYSCPAPNDVCRVGPNLATPFSDRLYFAGEHTCLPFFGYMEGALQSGADAAHAILRR